MTAFNEPDVLKKSSSVITARYKGDIVLDQRDRALMNYLLYRAWNGLAPQAVHRLPTKEVMEYARFKRHRELIESVNRLCKIVLEIDYIDDEGEERCITAHYLSTDVSKSDNGLLFYAFDAILYHFIAHPKVYAAISISRLRDMGSPMAIDLYEIMALQYRKKSPVFRTTPEELRNLLKVGDKHPRPDNFRKNVVEKTVAEVNAIAEFDIVFDYVRGGQGGGIVEIVFTAVPKSHNRLIEAANTAKVATGRGAGRKGDPRTIDMYDGLTDEERGAPATLSDRAIEGARGIVPEGANIHDYMADWRSQNQNKLFIDPDAAFLAWLKAKIEKDDDPLLRDLDDDVFGKILNMDGGRDG